MKGVVFTEFLEMIESKHGYSMVDDILINAEGVSEHYTSVGTYPHAEMVQLVVELSRRTQQPAELILEQFGAYLLKSFSRSHASFFNVDDAFTFLIGINEQIHKEVLKLYPDAELPQFDIEEPSLGILRMVYHSDRSMSHLALGLIKATIEYFNESISVEHIVLGTDGRKAEFILTKGNG